MINMNMIERNIRLVGYKNIVYWLLFAAVIVFIGLSFRESVWRMIGYWYTHEEFGHAFLLPFISGYFIWLKWDVIKQNEVTRPWVGILISILGVAIFVIGNIGAVFTLQQYALVILLVGIFITIFGVSSAKQVAIPLFLLFFMVPLPGFLYNTLSGQLQLISSQIGVYVIRLFDISVYLEGNVIDLGVYKLQVIEACSGLRYLFPLMTLGLIAAYIYRAPFWKKTLVFLSTIPITILMNSFRIGMIGVLVEYYGQSMAEGFLHDFEGWVIFMACMSILLLEMWLLAKIGDKKATFSEIFNLNALNRAPEEELEREKHNLLLMPVWMVFLLAIVLLGYISTLYFQGKNHILPNRTQFSSFPMDIGEYQGKKEIFDVEIIQALNFDDYLLANYITDAGDSFINVYIGYYETQNAEKVPHSPKACLPGGGWVVSQSDVMSLDVNSDLRKTIDVNRVVIYKGNVRQLVYYWFKQRDRNVTSEYLVKWHLLVDSIFRNRSDGALIRYVTEIRRGEDMAQADKRLANFVGASYPLLHDYIPD